MTHISSYADVASKSPANFKPKPALFLSTVIPKFDAITYPSLYNVRWKNKKSCFLDRPGKPEAQLLPARPLEQRVMRRSPGNADALNVPAISLAHIGFLMVVGDA
jgi:hypothetical protein